MPTEAEKNEAILAAADIVTAKMQEMRDLLADPPPEGVTWDRTGVANNPTFSNGDKTAAATGAHLIRASVLITPADLHSVNVDSAGSSGYLGVCLISAGQSLTTPPASLAAVPAGVWCWRSDGYSANAGASQNNQPTFGTGDKITLELTSAGEMKGYKNDVLVGTLFTGLTGDFACGVAFFGANGGPAVTLEVV